MIRIWVNYKSEGGYGIMCCSAAQMTFFLYVLLWFSVFTDYTVNSGTMIYRSFYGPELDAAILAIRLLLF